MQKYGETEKQNEATEERNGRTKQRNSEFLATVFHSAFSTIEWNGTANGSTVLVTFFDFYCIRTYPPVMQETACLMSHVHVYIYVYEK